MDMHALTKTLHLLGACLFVGNIIVSGFWKALADRTNDLAVARFATRLVNLTDAVFTGGGATLLAVCEALQRPDAYWSYPVEREEGRAARTRSNICFCSLSSVQSARADRHG